MDTAWLVFMAAARLTFQRIAVLLIANILWWLFSILIITWPPATAGLYHVVRCLTDQKVADQVTWRDFFVGFRTQGWLAWQLMALNVAAGLILMVGFQFYFNQTYLILRLIAAPIFCLILLWAGMQLYLFPLLIEQKNKQLRLIFKNAYLLVLKNLVFSLVLGLLLISVILVSSTLTGPLLLILISFLAVAQTLAMQRLLGLNINPS